MGGKAGRNPGLAPRAMGAMEGVRAADGGSGHSGSRRASGFRHVGRS